MAILMLKDTPVYDIAKDKVLSAKHCPFTDFTNTKRSYEKWRENRSYLRTNRLAEQLIARMGGPYTREAKRRLSLSDSYWVRYSYDEETNFDTITPYSNPFSELVTYAGRSSSIPELTLTGSQPKSWRMDPETGLTYMVKIEAPEQVYAEMMAVKLARHCRIPVMNAFIDTDAGRIYADDFQSLPKGHGVINLVNLTTPDISLIQLDQLGILPKGNDPQSVLSAYEEAGVVDPHIPTVLLQVLFDGIVGNPDRETNNSNWAIYLDNKTGERTVSPLYDFNWANLQYENPTALQHLSYFIKKADIVNTAVKQAKVVEGACKQLGLTLWQHNARRIIEELGYT